MDKKSLIKNIVISTLFIIGILILVFDKQTSIFNTSNNDNLTFDYQVKLLDEATKYVSNLESNNVTELNLNAKELVKDDEFKYCKGNVLVKRTVNKFYQYTFNVDCYNKNDNDNPTKIVAYTNVDKEYHKYYYFSRNNSNENNLFGYTEDFDIKDAWDDYDDEYYVAFNPISVSGIFETDEDLNITKYIELDEPATELNQRIYKTNFGYVLENFHYGKKADKAKFTFYDKDLNKKFDYVMKKTDVNRYLYADMDTLYLANHNYLVKVDLKTFKVTKIKLNDNKKAAITYNDGILYTHSFYINAGDKDYHLYKYTLDGELISHINMNEFLPEAEANYISIVANQKYFIISSSPINYNYDDTGMELESTYLGDKTYVLNNDGEIISSTPYKASYIEILDEGFNMTVDNNNSTSLLKFDKDMKEYKSYTYESEYVTNKLADLYNNKYDDIRNGYVPTNLKNGNIYRSYHLVDNNGTLVFVKYEK